MALNSSINEMATQNTRLKLQLEEYERKEKYQSSVFSMSAKSHADRPYKTTINYKPKSDHSWIGRMGQYNL